MSQRGYSPFGWDFDVAVGEHFTEFLQYNLASDVCASGVGQSTKQMRKSKYRLLGHCKNYIPLDILKRGMLNEKILELKAMVRWLNEIPCKRDLVCSMVFELYLHIFWILIFIRATWRYMEPEQQLEDWAPISLLVCSTLFFIQEIYQMFRFYMTSAGVAYWLDVWNWIDLSAVGLVVSSSIKFLQNDGSAQKSLLMTTGFFQFILLISYLKKTFFPFSKFVFGIIEVSCMGDCYSIRFFSTMATDGLHCTLRKIFWAIVPFLCIGSTLTKVNSS